ASMKGGTQANFGPRQKCLTAILLKRTASAAIRVRLGESTCPRSGGEPIPSVCASVAEDLRRSPGRGERGHHVQFGLAVGGDFPNRYSIWKYAPEIGHATNSCWLRMIICGPHVQKRATGPSVSVGTDRSFRRSRALKQSQAEQ